MKKYYSFEDALDFLNANQKYKYRMHDLQDMIARQIIFPCFYYKGSIAKAVFMAGKTGMICTGEKFFFNGYLDLGVRIFNDIKFIKPPFFVKEAIQMVSMSIPNESPKYYRGELDKNGHPVFFIVITEALLDMPATKSTFLYESALFGISLPLEQIFISIDELEKIVQPQQVEKQNLTPTESITTLQAVGIMAELLALEDGCYKYRKGESNVNAAAIGTAVSNRAKARFGDNVRGFESFNRKISEGLKALEDLEKK